jgi:prefoldin subunit 5
LVGKPELSIEKKIEMAESSLEKQIDALQDEITNGQIEFKKRPGTLQSKTN